MNPLVRNILIIGTVLVLGSLTGGFMLWVLPVESQIAELNRKLEEQKATRDRGREALKSLEASNSVIREQLDTLALFDLREEQDPENVLQTRSNSQRIQVSKIFEDATVSVSELNLASSENAPIADASGSTPIASIQKQHFKLHATGFYRDFLAAFERLKKLPPTVAVNNYTVTYLEKVGAQAKVDVTMDVSFNFLMKPVAAPAGAPAAGVNAFEQMMQKLSGKGGFLIDRILKMADLLVPPAYAATGRLEVSGAAVRIVPDEPVGFRTFRLKDGRVVVDMPGLRVGHKQIVRVGRSGVRTARLAQLSTRPLVGRLVLDTTHGWVAPRRGPRGSVVVPLAGEVDARFAGNSTGARERRHLAGTTGQSARDQVAAGGTVAVGAFARGVSPDADGRHERRPKGRALPGANLVAPAVRATPMPARVAELAAPAATRPAPEPEPEPVLRRVAVRPWAVGEVRRVAVQPWSSSVGLPAAEIRRIDVRPEDPGLVLSPALAPVLVNNPTGMAVVPGKQSGVFQVVQAPPGAKPVIPPASGGATGSPAAAGTGSVLPGRRVGVGLPEVQVGRAEPFFPLFDATDDIGFRAWEASRNPAGAAASPSATASATPMPVAVVTPPPAVTPQPALVPPPVPQIVPVTPPPPQRLAVTLRGVLMAGDRAYGLFDVNGQTVRGTIGSALAPGYEVKAIGRNFALLSTPFGTERKALATTWMPVLNAPTFPTSGGGAAAGSSPLPALP